MAFDPIDLKAATWVRDHLDEIIWWQGLSGGFVAMINQEDPRNRVMLNISGSGLTIMDGLINYKIIAPDFTPYRSPKRGGLGIKKWWNEKILKKPVVVTPQVMTEMQQDQLQEVLQQIHDTAGKQILSRIGDDKWKKKIRDDLFRKMMGGWNNL